MPDPHQEDAFVSDLIKDARLIADYGRLSGTFKDDALFQALADAENLSEKTIGKPEIIRLQRCLNDAARLVPFTTFIALNNDWSPRRSSRKSNLATYALVGFSIALMLVTGKLTYTYNSGVEIAHELTALENENVEQRFREILTKLLAAESETSVSNGSTAIKSFQREAIYQIQSDLRKIDARLLLTRQALNKFNYQASYPIWGMRSLHCLYARVSSSLRRGASAGSIQLSAVNGDQKSQSNLSIQDLQILSVCSTDFSNAIGGNYAYRDQCGLASDSLSTTGLQKDFQTTRGQDGPIEQLTQISNRLYCANTISTDPWTISVFASTQANFLKSILDPYALLLLPAIYGALGALMFQMRRVLDPLSPNPPLVRIVHRLALGALAGTILAWFIGPEQQFGAAGAGIGFGLFSFAFLFGFSIDVFFTVLDKFVDFANKTVSGIGARNSSTPDSVAPKTSAAPAQSAANHTG